MEGTSQRYEYEDGSFVEVGIARVPPSRRYPTGVKYRFQYVDPDGEPCLRYDNAHGQHERHRGPDGMGQPIDYAGDLQDHLRRFFAEVDRIHEE